MTSASPPKYMHCDVGRCHKQCANEDKAQLKVRELHGGVQSYLAGSEPLLDEVCKGETRLEGKI